MVYSKEEQRAWSRALRYLSTRPRSEAEMEKYLLANHSGEVVAKTIDLLKLEDLVNDVSFAELWVRSRMENRPRSAALIRKELAMKGIGSSISNEFTAELDDLENAYILVAEKLSKSTFASYGELYAKAKRYLLGKGFAYSVISSTTQRYWSEKRD